MSLVCDVHPPTLVSVPVQNLKTKYGTNKRNSAGLESGEFNPYYFEIKGALITRCKDETQELNMKSKCALSLGGGAHLSDVLTLLQAGDPGAKAMALGRVMGGGVRCLFTFLGVDATD